MIPLTVMLALVSVGGGGITVKTAGAAAEVDGGLSFIDRFARLDRDRWFVSNGWANGPHQACTWTNRNVHAGAGGLTLSLTNQPSGERAYSCAEIQTKEYYGYGTYEVRMRAAAAPGIVSAFFTYVGPSIVKGSPHDEIDFEFLGKDRNGVQLNYFFNGRGEHEQIIALGFDASATMNDYAFEWTPQTLRWSVNGRLVREVNAPLPRLPGKIMLSIWSGVGANTEGWLGRFAYPGQPLTVGVEYVAFTEAGKPCQFPTSIVCSRGAESPSSK
jgi:endo-1,3-1,4-beta-glycanase ExoK